MARKRKIDDTEYTAEITALSHEGRGIAHLEDTPVFIFNALPGETVTFKSLRKRRKAREGIAINILHAAPERITPGCPHFDVCGGCSFQHVAPETQRDWKRAIVLKQLEQHQVAPLQLMPTLRGDTWGYRRKARLGVKYLAPKDIMLVGFRERQGRYLAHMDQCDVLDPRVGQQITALKTWLATLDAKAYIPQIEVAATDHEVALIIRHLEPLSDCDLAKIKQFMHTHNFLGFLQPKGIDSIHPIGHTQTYLHYTLPEFELTFRFQPFQFTQINETINRQMVKQAIAWLDPQPTDHIVDLFCGIGNFTLPTARRCAQVTGIEADKSAIDQANENATANQIDNVTFYVGNLFEDCTIFPWAKRSYDKILLDPPRSGADAIIEQFKYWQPTCIVYVSCNPATFVRDAAKLKTMGFKLERFCTMDMFPHTQHTEVMGRFTQLKS